MAKIGLVTVLYNSEKVLDEFYDSLNKQEFKDFCLYVINNNSPDNSLEKSKELSKNVFFKSIFIDNNENFGVAKGNNQGIEAALSDGCEYVLLTNNDVVLQPDTISLLYERHVEYKADMSVPKIYYADTDKRLWACGGYLNKFRGTSFHYGDKEVDNGQFDRNKKVEYSPTCFMLINKSVFDKVGMMDEKYFVYYDDTDFVYRAVNKEKLSLYYFYEPVLYHKESYCTRNTSSNFKDYYTMRNRIYFEKKFNHFFAIKYFMNVSYHLIFRKITLRNDKERWDLLYKAMKDGKKY